MLQQMLVTPFPGFSGAGIHQALPGPGHYTGLGLAAHFEGSQSNASDSVVKEPVFAPLLMGTEVMASVLNQPC